MDSIGSLIERLQGLISKSFLIAAFIPAFIFLAINTAMFIWVFPEYKPYFNALAAFEEAKPVIFWLGIVLFFFVFSLSIWGLAGWFRGFLQGYYLPAWLIQKMSAGHYRIYRRQKDESDSLNLDLFWYRTMNSAQGRDRQKLIHAKLGKARQWGEDKDKNHAGCYPSLPVSEDASERYLANNVTIQELKASFEELLNKKTSFEQDIENKNKDLFEYLRICLLKYHYVDLVVLNADISKDFQLELGQYMNVLRLENLKQKVDLKPISVKEMEELFKPLKPKLNGNKSADKEIAIKDDEKKDFFIKLYGCWQHNQFLELKGLVERITYALPNKYLDAIQLISGPIRGVNTGTAVEDIDIKQLKEKLEVVEKEKSTFRKELVKVLEQLQTLSIAHCADLLEDLMSDITFYFPGECASMIDRWKTIDPHKLQKNLDTLKKYRKAEIPAKKKMIFLLNLKKCVSKFKYRELCEIKNCLQALLAFSEEQLSANTGFDGNDNRNAAPSHRIENLKRLLAGEITDAKKGDVLNEFRSCAEQLMFSSLTALTAEAENFFPADYDWLLPKPKTKVLSKAPLVPNDMKKLITRLQNEFLTLLDETELNSIQATDTTSFFKNLIEIQDELFYDDLCTYHADMKAQYTDDYERIITAPTVKIEPDINGRIIVDLTSALKTLQAKQQQWTIIPHAEMKDVVKKLEKALKRISVSKCAELDALHIETLQVFEYALERIENHDKSLYETEKNSYPNISMLGPTRMANHTSIHREYGMKRYGMEIEFFWLRLLKIVKADKDFYPILEEAKTQVDFSVISTILLGLTTFVWVIISACAPYIQPFGLIVLTGIPATSIFYITAVQNYKTFTEAVRSAVDLHRFELLTALHIALPEDADKEYDTWIKIFNWKESNDTQPVKYQHGNSVVPAAPST